MTLTEEMLQVIRNDGAKWVTRESEGEPDRAVLTLESNSGIHAATTIGLDTPAPWLANWKNRQARSYFHAKGFVKAHLDQAELDTAI